MTPNILLDTLPDAVMVNGRGFPIATDYTAGIRFEQLMYDREATDAERAVVAVEDIYFPGAEYTPEDRKDMLDGISWFYCCGKPPNPKDKRKPKHPAGIKAPRIYDFDHDAQYIYAAFMAAYRIDLSDTSLHWWLFRALFNALPSETEFVKIMGYRATDVSKIKDKAQKAHIRRLQELYRLPVEMSEEDKVAAAGAIFAGGIRS